MAGVSSGLLTAKLAAPAFTAVFNNDLPFSFK